MLNLQSRLATEIAFTDVNVGYQNRMANNLCLLADNVEEAERQLNNIGYTMVGVCSDVPLGVNLGDQRMSLLVVRKMDNEALYWMHLPASTLEAWKSK